MALGADALEILRDEPVPVDVDHDGAPPHKSRATRELGVGGRLVGDVVAGHGEGEMAAITPAWTPSVGTIVSSSGR